MNLLPLLRALLQTESVSAAAESVNLSQGAASNALARLRVIFSDPLLVRVGARMHLTPFGSALRDQVDGLCDSIEAVLTRSRFDPAQLKRTFVVSTGDYASFMFAEPLLAAISGEAPGVKLRFVNLADNLPDRMANREIDLAIVPDTFVEAMGEARLEFSLLIAEPSVAVFRRDHPLARDAPVTVAELARFEAIAFHPSLDWIERRNATAFLGGHDFAVAAYMPQLTLAPFLLLNTDYFCILPLHFAARVVRHLPLESRPLGFGAPIARIGQTWSAVQDLDPAHRWFRSLVQQVADAAAGLLLDV